MLTNRQFNAIIQDIVWRANSRPEHEIMLGRYVARTIQDFYPQLRPMHCSQSVFLRLIQFDDVGPYIEELRKLNVTDDE